MSTHKHMTRKNLIIYLHHLVENVASGHLSIQTAMSQIMMIPSRLNNAGLLHQIYKNEDADAGVKSRQRLIDSDRMLLANPTTDNHTIERCQKEITSAEHNLNPYVSVDGNKLSPSDFTGFVWDLCLDINNPEDSDVTYPTYNRTIYVGGAKTPSTDVDFPSDVSRIVGISTDTDKQWLTKIARVREKQDAHWGRINHLKNRI